jgi:hypothetical protein
MAGSAVLAMAVSSEARATDSMIAAIAKRWPADIESSAMWAGLGVFSDKDGLCKELGGCMRHLPCGPAGAPDANEAIVTECCGSCWLPRKNARFERRLQAAGCNRSSRN